MAITFLQPDGVPITAQQFRQGQAATHGAGFGRQLGGRSGLRLGTPSNVLTATSTTWTLGPCAAMIDPGATTHQGVYGWANDSNVTGSVTAADATYARKDIVYIQVNDSSAGDGSGALTAPVLYLAGSATATPEAPTLPARSLLIGTISVPAAGGGSPTVILNPARYVSAGGLLPVGSAADRPSSPYTGQRIQRTDRNSHVQEFNGSAWQWVSIPERYYANPTSFVTAASNVSKLIGAVTSVPVRAYATKVRVNGRLSVSCAAISTGTLSVKVAVSAVVGQVGSAQAKSFISFSAPGSYWETRNAETDWIAVASGVDPLARVWIEHIQGTVNHAASGNAVESHLWVEVLPADD